MTVPQNYKQLKQQYDGMSSGTKTYMRVVGELLKSPNNLDVCLAYCFIKLEEGQHRALKCGLIRNHECDVVKVDDVLKKQHFTRKSFINIFNNIFGKGIPNSASKHHDRAQIIRNKMIHGKGLTPSEARSGIHYALKYMEELGIFV